jgi:hypothetical protein
VEASPDSSLVTGGRHDGVRSGVVGGSVAGRTDGHGTDVGRRRAGGRGDRAPRAGVSTGGSRTARRMVTGPEAARTFERRAY